MPILTWQGRELPLSCRQIYSLPLLLAVVRRIEFSLSKLILEIDLQSRSEGVIFGKSLILFIIDLTKWLRIGSQVSLVARGSPRTFD